MLAMNQDLFAALRALSNEGNAPLQVVIACRFQVGSGQVQELDAGSPKLRLIITILRPQIDDGANTMSLAKLIGAIHREAAPDGHFAGEPVKIGKPVATHLSIFFFNSSNIFFFIKVQGGGSCCFAFWILLF